MRRVQEVIHITAGERDSFLQKVLNPSKELQQIYWMHGVRNQYYFNLDSYILMTFEYVGHQFKEDMASLTAHLEKEGQLVEKRRRDIAPDRLDQENWWAPLQKLGACITENPMPADNKEEITMYYSEMVDGAMRMGDSKLDLAYDEDDWSESLHM